MALYLRYQTTHDRAFHRCFSDLLRLRADQRKAEAGFVSQQYRQAAEARKQELHDVRLHAAKWRRRPQTSPATQHPEPILTAVAPQNPPAIEECVFGDLSKVA
jgi:hypothetical protein